MLLKAAQNNSCDYYPIQANKLIAKHRSVQSSFILFYVPDCIENSKSYGGGGLYLQSINQVTLGYDVVFNNVPENTNASESYFASAGLSIFNQYGQVSFSLSSQNYIGCVCLTFLHCAF